MKPPKSLIVERVTAALCDLTKPGDIVRALDWIDHAMHGDDLDRGLVELLLNGTARISLMVDGEPRFRLTQAGADEFLQLISDNADMRTMFERLTGNAVVAPPSKEQ